MFCNFYEIVYIFPKCFRHPLDEFPLFSTVSRGYHFTSLSKGVLFLKLMFLGSSGEQAPLRGWDWCVKFRDGCRRGLVAGPCGWPAGFSLLVPCAEGALLLACAAVSCGSAPGQNIDTSWGSGAPEVSGPCLLVAALLSSPTQDPGAASVGGGRWM